MPVRGVAPARSAGDAFQRFLEQIQPAISGIAGSAGAILIRSGYDRRVGAELVTLAGGDPVTLRSADGRARVALAIRLHCRVTETRAPRGAVVALTAYSYKFEGSADPSRELIRFDWHPHVSEEVPFPHAHVPVPGSEGVVVSGKTHIPTPHMTLADVFRFAVHEFDVAPPTDKVWPARLEEAHRAMRGAFPDEAQVT